MFADDHRICMTALRQLQIRFFSKWEEYFFNALIFTAIFQFSICNLRFTIPACPG